MSKITIRKLSKPNCKPCAALSNYIASVSEELTELNAEVFSHDITEEPALIERYGLMSVPVMIFERNGLAVARLDGLVSPQEILDTVEYAKEVR